MSKMKRLYEDICELINDYYDDDEIAIELQIPESMVKSAREMYMNGKDWG